MALNTIDEREAVMAMRIAAGKVPEVPPDVTHVNGRVAQEWEMPHLAAGIRRERAQGASAVAGVTGEQE